MISWAFVDTLAITPAVTTLQKQALSDASQWSSLLARCSYFPSVTLRNVRVLQFSCLASQLIRKYSSQASANTDSFLFQIHSGCFSEPGLDGETLSVSNSAQIHTCPTLWKALRGNDLPHTITSFLTLLCFIRNSISAVNFLSPTCFMVDQSWLVLKARVCFSVQSADAVQRVQGPALAGGLHHRVYSIYSSSWLSPCVLHLRGRAGVVRRRWFVDILVSYRFQQRCIESVFWFHVFIALQQQA